MPEIRKAEPADAPGIARIHADAWRAAYHDFIPADFLDNRAKFEPRLKLWNGLLSGEHESHYVVTENGKTAGFFSIQKARDDDLPPDTLELVAIYLDQVYWRRGFGAAAMRFILEQAAKRGYRQVCLWVFRQNTGAIAFYEKFGFRFDGKTNELMLGGPVTECRYRLSLQEK